MKINLSLLRTLWPEAQFFRISEDVRFDYIDVMPFSGRNLQPQDLQVVLWCGTRSLTMNDFSWYGEYFDRVATELEAIVAERGANWIYLVDQEDVTNRFPDIPFIVVDAIQPALERIVEYILKTLKPIVCGITGSVGKTTAVGLLEVVLGTQGAVSRFYAKRITPLSLIEMIIDRVDIDNKLVVLEYSMYHRWHIAELVRILPAAVAGILNIEYSHVGVDSIRSKRDIAIAKLPLLERATVAFVPLELEKLIAARVKQCVLIDPLPDTHGIVSIAEQRVRFTPFISTHLAYTQAAMCLHMYAKLFGTITQSVISVIEQYEPKENRLMKVRCKTREIIFDGDATNASRLFHLARNSYNTAALIVCDVDFGEEPLARQRVLLKKLLPLFSQVYLATSIDERYSEFLNGVIEAVANVQYFQREEQLALPSYETYFVHWGSYWRNNRGSLADLQAMF